MGVEYVIKLLESNLSGVMIAIATFVVYRLSDRRLSTETITALLRELHSEDFHRVRSQLKNQLVD